MGVRRFEEPVKKRSMMSTLRGLTILVVSVLSILTGGSAGAEPVVITAGQVETSLALGLARVEFEGDGFFLRTGVEGFRSELAFCLPCAPGTVTLSGSLEATSIRGGEARVDGATYDEIRIGTFSATFTTGAVTLTGADQVVTVPFIFSGLVSGFLTDPSQPLFTTALSGAGVATGRFTAFGSEGGLINAAELRYDFSGAEPVPEPSTIILVSAGLAAAARRRWRLPRAR